MNRSTRTPSELCLSWFVTNSGIISKRERILGGLWGSLVGDALGVPVEFKDRASLQANPVTDMRGHGTHRQLAGTWSDDSSLLLCSVESLVETGDFDADDMGQRFVRWRREELWTPHGQVFDIGGTTEQALSQIASGMPAELAGGTSEDSNGNGSLMRIIPVAMRFAELPAEQLLDRVHRASSITHRHPRSQMACGLYSVLLQELFNWSDWSNAVPAGVKKFHRHYTPNHDWSVELDHFRRIMEDSLGDLPEREIRSGGYVIHTLEASLWCVLTTSSFEEAVLKSVNLGGDTDTTACVAGGLAGVVYGSNAIPQRWVDALARKPEVEILFNRFAQALG